MRHVTRLLVVVFILSAFGVAGPALAQDEPVCEGLEITHEFQWCGGGVSTIVFEWTAVEGATSYSLLLIPEMNLNWIFYFDTIDPGKLVAMSDLMVGDQVPTGDYYYTVYANGAEGHECHAGVHTFTLGDLSTCGTPGTCTTCPNCCEPPEYSSIESFCTMWCTGIDPICYIDCLNYADCDLSESGNGCLSCIFRGG